MALEPSSDLDPSALHPVEEGLGYHFQDRSLLDQALTHVGFANRFGVGETGGNQRLEFLGDAVLGCVLAEALYRHHPDGREGKLTRRRSELICGRELVKRAAELGLGELLRLDPSSTDAVRGKVSDALVEDAFEAVVGAVFLDGGYVAAQAVVERLFRKEIGAPIEESGSGQANPKGALQEWAQAQPGGTLPVYNIVKEEGEDHAKRFTARVDLAGRFAIGEGSSRKDAERAAAALLLGELIDISAPVD